MTYILAADLARNDPKSNHLAKASVLVVDDEPDITDALKRGLEGEGFRVHAFNDPEIALAEFKRGEYDIAILDIRMPKMNGFELYREMRKRDGQTTFCFLTAFDVYQSEFEKLFPEMNVKMLLKKPITAAQLASRLEELMGPGRKPASVK